MLDMGQDKIHQSLEEWFDSQEFQEKYPYINDYIYSFINKLFRIWLKGSSNYFKSDHSEGDESDDISVYIPTPTKASAVE